MSFMTKRPKARKIMVLGGALSALLVGVVPSVSAAPVPSSFHIKASNEPNPAFWGIYPKLNPGTPGNGTETPGSGEVSPNPGSGEGDEETPGGGVTPVPTNPPVEPTPEVPLPNPEPDGKFIFTVNMSALGCGSTTNAFTLGFPSGGTVYSPTGREFEIPRQVNRTYSVDESGQWIVDSDVSQISFAQNKCLISVDKWEDNGAKSARFAQASNLTSVVKPPTSITDMSSMFTSATSFDGDLSDWDMSKVTNVSRMFTNASKFTGKGVEKWDTSSVLYMGEAFSGARSFTGDISNWKINRASMNGILKDVNNNYNVDLSKWDVCHISPTSDTAKTFGSGTTYAAKKDLHPKWGVCS